MSILDIKELTIDDKDIFDNIINLNRSNSESSFANLFIWSDVYNTKYTLIDGMICVFYTTKSGILKAVYPFGNGNVKDVILKIKSEIFNDKNSFVMTAVCERDKALLESAFGDKVSFEYDRDSSEYVYLAENLANLTGKNTTPKETISINSYQTIITNIKI